MIPELPLPRPMFEIWVYSPRVEGVHLRGGPVARGGLRWSDRREDFRTEVLGLMKAQMVKNAVIVPVGAKGGFVVKRRERIVDPDELRREVAACYREFVAGLLDLTDNVVDGEVVPPPAVVRHDGDDPYLVVAADKGTATFSDLANEVAAGYGFWLGDAFASGGSDGLRPQGDGHHGPGRVGERAPPRPHARAGRRHGPAHRGRHRRHVAATSSATACCAARTSGWWPPSTIATSSSTPTPTRLARSTSDAGCSSCPARAGPTTTGALISAVAGCSPARPSRSRCPTRSASASASTAASAHARTSSSAPSSGRRSTCCGTAASAPT